jgi:hypothetical protein
MTLLEFKTHPVWQNLTEVLENLDASTLVTEHLDFCHYKVCGYWDEEDNFYEEITLPSPLSAELASSSIGFTGRQRWIQLKFDLKADTQDRLNSQEPQKIGELTLTYNENLEFLDENWRLDVSSPLLIAKPQQQ